MHNRLAMRRVQRARHLDRQAQGFVRRQRSLLQTRRQGFALDHLHDDGRLPFAILHAVDCADVRVVERRGGPRLPPEPLQRVRVACQVARQEFQRHLTAQSEVLRPVNHSHPAAAQLLDHREMGDGLAFEFARIESGRRRRARRGPAGVFLERDLYLAGEAVAAP